MPDPVHSPAPVAVVALGDPDRRDDGIALRVIGRVRTLVAELGCARVSPQRTGHARRNRDGGEGSRVSSKEFPFGEESGAAHVDFRDRSDARVPGRSVALVPSPSRSTLIEWIEGGTDVQRLDPLLAGRQRVVLVDAVRLSGRPGQVHHWHLQCLPDSRLSVVRRFNTRAKLGMQHLALWLEDELPERGTDLIGIEPHDLGEGTGLSRVLRRQLPTISSQVAAILVRLLEEEGW
jgi:hydrogenase maturation protease